MRADKAYGTTPKCGNSIGAELGVRSIDVKDAKDPENDNKIKKESGGTSTSISREGVPTHTVANFYTVPNGTGGRQSKDNANFKWLWSLDDSKLPENLTARTDANPHCSIEPKESGIFTEEEFAKAVQDTAPCWVRIDESE